MVQRLPYAEIEIATGWRLADITTTEEADEAMLHLTREIASIEAQLAEFESNPDHKGVWSEWEDPGEWHRSARSAARIKREIYTMVQKKRVEIIAARKRDFAESYDRRLLGVLKLRAPDAFAAAIAEVGR